MYSEKLKNIKYPCKFPASDGRIGIGPSGSVDRELLKQRLTEFCTRDDLLFAEQKKALDLFDEYCRENGYPLIHRRSVGLVIREVFNVKTRPVRIDGEVRKVYI